MGGLVESVANVLPMILDPANVTGIQDSVSGGSGNSGGHVPTQPTLPNPVSPNGTDRFSKDDPGEGYKGFIESMGGWGGNKFSGGPNARIAPPPPSQWNYVAGKGPAWQTPERVGTTNDFTMNNNFPGSPGFNPKGNRF